MSTDSLMIVRLLRVIAGAGLLSTPEAGKFEMTDFSEAHAEPVQQAAWRLCYDLIIPAYVGMPAWLKKHGYRNKAGSPIDTAWGVGKGVQGSLWDHWKSKESEYADFSNCMRGYGTHMGPWYEVYPSEELLKDAGDKVLVVDVGGSLGHDLIGFAQKHKVAQDKVVLQDVPEVLKDAMSSTAMTIQAHDFFTPQPVKGECCSMRASK